jgi:hypothetical protein
MLKRIANFFKRDITLYDATCRIAQELRDSPEYFDAVQSNIATEVRKAHRDFITNFGRRGLTRAQLEVVAQSSANEYLKGFMQGLD